MNPAPLQRGIQAFKQGQFPEAIQTLERFCEDPESTAQVLAQAQGWLVRAYLRNNQPSQALALCQQLTQTDNPKVRQWATDMVSKLSAQPSGEPTVGTASPSESPSLTPADTAANSGQSPLAHLAPTALLSPEAAEQCLETGIKELRRRDYSAAIATLENFMRGTDESYPNYAWGRTSLAKAYKGNGQYEAAIALCNSMLGSDRERTRAWARDFLKSLPKELINPEPEGVATPPQPIEQSTLSEAEAPVIKMRASRAPLSSRVSQKPQPVRASTDLTPQLLSGLAHGSVSLLASLLLYLLFADSIAANALGLLRMAVPIIILVKTQDDTVKANAREATNYVVTAIAWIILLSVGSFFLALGVVAVGLIFWPLLLLLGAVIVIYMLAFSIWPIYAAIVAFRQPGRVIRYPDWLVLHLF
ncbi:MAG: tetratricopeptide repeat protein [Leptolyngbyaceae cyanobacterium]